MRDACTAQCPGAFLDKSGRLADFCSAHLLGFCKWVLNRTRSGAALYIASSECVTIFSPVRNGLYGIATFPNILSSHTRAKFDFHRKLVGPCSPRAAALHAAFCCGHKEATMAYVTETAPPSGSGYHTALCIPPLESVIVRRQSGGERELDWDVVARYLPACTLSVVFKQTHNPDPTQPQAGVSTLYEWATGRRPISSTLWTVKVA